MTLIHPDATPLPEYFHHCVRSASVLRLLVWKDLRLRYRKPAIAVLSAILQPILGGVCLSWVLHRDNARDPRLLLSTLTGFLVFQLLARAITRGGVSLRENEMLAARVYFPRIFLPVSATFSCLVDFLLGAFACAGVSVLLGTSFDFLMVLSAVVAIAGLVLGACGVAAVASVVDAYVPDFRYAVPFLVQMSLFLSPVFFQTESVRGPARWYLYAHPLSASIELLRFSLGAGEIPSSLLVATSFASGLALCITGITFFQRKEHAFSERNR